MARPTAQPNKRARLSKDDLAYHIKLVERIEQARAMEQEIERTQASTASWIAHLQEKYELVDGDVVAADGVITRTA